MSQVVRHLRISAQFHSTFWRKKACMRPKERTHKRLKNTRKLSLNEIRQLWSDAWQVECSAHLGRTMLEKSLAYKLHEQDGYGLTLDQQTQLQNLVRQYKRNFACFDENVALKPGTRLIRLFESKKHSVVVK